MGTLIISGVLVLVVAFIVSGIIHDHKKGKHICGGNCSVCHGSCSHKLAK